MLLKLSPSSPSKIYYRLMDAQASILEKLKIFMKKKNPQTFSPLSQLINLLLSLQNLPRQDTQAKDKFLTDGNCKSFVESAIIKY